MVTPNRAPIGPRNAKPNPPKIHLLKCMRVEILVFKEVRSEVLSLFIPTGRETFGTAPYISERCSTQNS